MKSSFAFIVEHSVDVVASDGVTVIGTVQPGLQHEGLSIDEHWVTMSLPDGCYGYVPAAQVRWDIVDVSTAPPLPPPLPPPPPPAAAAVTTAPSPSAGPPP